MCSGEYGLKRISLLTFPKYCAIFLLICLEITLPEGHGKLVRGDRNSWVRNLKDSGHGQTCLPHVNETYLRQGEGAAGLLCHFCERTGFVFLDHFLR